MNSIDSVRDLRLVHYYNIKSLLTSRSSRRFLTATTIIIYQVDFENFITGSANTIEPNSSYRFKTLLRREKEDLSKFRIRFPFTAFIATSSMYNCLSAKTATQNYAYFLLVLTPFRL